MEKLKFKYLKGTENRITEIEDIIADKDFTDKFYGANETKVNKDSNTTKEIHQYLEQSATYILQAENITTKKTEYNILDEKRLKDVELNEQALPSYSNDNEETSAEGELTSALINNERLLKYEDTVYQLLKGDYELINEGAAIEDMWFYQTLPNEGARRPVEDCFNLIQYYLSEMKNTRSVKGIKVTRRKIKELLFGDISSIVRSYTKLEPIQKRSGVKANKNQVLEFSEDIATNKHHQIFKLLVTDKGSITNPTEVIPIVDVEQAIEKGIKNGDLNNGDIQMIELLKNYYHGDLIACLKADNNYKTNRRRFEKMVNKLEKLI